MNLIIIIRFMRKSFEDLSVASTKLPSGWWAFGTSHPWSKDMLTQQTYRYSMAIQCVGS